MNKRFSITSKNGISIEYNEMKIVLDPHKASDGDVVFISHAHIDHMHTPKRGTKVLASKETAFLAKERSFDLGETEQELDGFQLIDSGHILGSRGLLINEDIFYTGDFITRPRAFLSRCQSVKCKTLIIESTYGKDYFYFPPLTKILNEVNRLISDLFSQGIPVVLMGYPLGKGQVLSYLFSSWDPIYVHETVQKMNDAYIKMGVDLRKFVSYREAIDKGLLRKKPWILIAPMTSRRKDFVRLLKKRFNAVTVAFSGWSVLTSYKYAMSYDYAFPLSDHCDFDELVNFIKDCEPEKVYTVHGFSSELASHLRERGYDAIPL
ncbi:MAG: MBL fold metallo-hydrolase [Candidatus Methylarchaceae archaeon HK01M]|nr:MBL fold metallo-hydrolase [Candidatus Methylarchaceae archaeon HK01M]